MSKPCEHLKGIPLDPMPEGGCEECLEMGDTWLHLRYCVACGHNNMDEDAAVGQIAMGLGERQQKIEEMDRPRHWLWSALLFWH